MNTSALQPHSTSCLSSWLKRTLGPRKFRKSDQSHPRWSFRTIPNNRRIGTNRTPRTKTTITLTSTYNSLSPNTITSKCQACTKLPDGGSNLAKTAQSRPSMSKFSHHFQETIMKIKSRQKWLLGRIIVEDAEAKSANLSFWARKNARKWMKSLISLTCLNRYVWGLRRNSTKSRGSLLSIRQYTRRIKWQCLRQRHRRRRLKLRWWKDTYLRNIIINLAHLINRECHKSQRLRS